MSAIDWKNQRTAFLAAKEEQRDQARQRAALQILCSEDLDAVMMRGDEGKAQLCRRLKRLIERERLKGVKGHWSYDLNRHIGLKQALESLRASMSTKQDRLARAPGGGFAQGVSEPDVESADLSRL